MDEISPEELERLLAALGTGDGSTLKPLMEELAPEIAPDLLRLLQHESFRDYLWQGYGKANIEQIRQVEISGRIVDFHYRLSRDSFMLTLQSWARKLLLPLPQAQEEPLLTFLQECQRRLRHDHLSMTHDPLTGANIKREASEKEKRWWDFKDACRTGNLPDVRAAVESGVLDEHEDGASMGLFCALIGDRTENQRAVASYLLENGANIETEINAAQRRDLLHDASRDGDLETVKFLLNHGGKADGRMFFLEFDENRDDPNYCGLDDNPLIAAAMGDHMAVLEILIAAGANVQLWCEDYGSALDCAGSPEAIELLKAHGATYHYNTED